jgi:DNA-binding NarL/FixJ family response regulator
LRTKARIRYKKQTRIQRQAGERIAETLSGDQRRVLALSVEGYEPTEIARELALPDEYVVHFMTGLVQRLSHEGLIPSPEWRNAVKWAQEEGLLPE